MHVKLMNIILGAIFFVLMSSAEVVRYFAKRDMELSDLLKKLGLYALVGVFITLFTTLESLSHVGSFLFKRKEEILCLFYLQMDLHLFIT